MEKRITRLSEEMDKHLGDLEEKYDDMGALARNATILLSEAIETLQEFISGHAFDDQTEEIAFFKNVHTTCRNTTNTSLSNKVRSRNGAFGKTPYWSGFPG